jgi:hypothetical protein
MTCARGSTAALGAVVDVVCAEALPAKISQHAAASKDANFIAPPLQAHPAGWSAMAIPGRGPSLTSEEKTMRIRVQLDAGATTEAGIDILGRSYK